ncbi:MULTISPECIES: type II toxin-antitoxin system RelE/ParE family toxin [unclassified Mesorhizobium]|uniref:type II toxin-antitoxin system RelE/ParE family toxin n=1 Tax=unclassified Mesorhizobium TaxID=325217 RepID=UPI0011265BE2|nr:MULTISPECIES: type II toxin-antitoxin system RelE/ParE family toxin [unclassified Mesorhizobium]TPN45030.1 type II toxin-antitoxin system RelE/ParE family toxin [Mesorhizobium sp. B1-1-9]TPN49921.1 type II toxin-antitoxin system RelE/ParE family toxin [Mesorhizobium sp. B1-1-7]
MTNRAIFRPSAQSDLFAIYNYIEKESSAARAGGYIDRIEAACMALSTFPERGIVRDAVGSGVRVVGFERRASILFRVDAEQVLILRILYGGQDYPTYYVDETDF